MVWPFGPFQGQPVSLARCWKCGINEVPEDDELGCCPSCIEMLKDPTYSSPAPSSAALLQAEVERIERLEREMRESG